MKAVIGLISLQHFSLGPALCALTHFKCWRGDLSTQDRFLQCLVARTDSGEADLPRPQRLAGSGSAVGF